MVLVMHNSSYTYIKNGNVTQGPELHSTYVIVRITGVLLIKSLNTETAVVLPVDQARKMAKQNQFNINLNKTSWSHLFPAIWNIFLRIRSHLMYYSIWLSTCTFWIKLSITCFTNTLNMYNFLSKSSYFSALAMNYRCPTSSFHKVMKKVLQ